MSKFDLSALREPAGINAVASRKSAAHGEELAQMLSATSITIAMPITSTATAMES